MQYVMTAGLAKGADVGHSEYSVCADGTSVYGPRMKVLSHKLGVVIHSTIQLLFILHP